MCVACHCSNDGVVFLVFRLAGGHEPSQLDSAFTNSLGTMFDVIEDADVQSQEQEKLLINMNSSTALSMNLYNIS